MTETNYFVSPTRHRIRLPKIFWAQFAAATIGLLIITIIYWFLLLSNQNAVRVYIQEQTSLRAARLAQALTVQIDTQFVGLAAIMRAVSNNYLAYGMPSAILTANSAIESMPKGTIFQIAITDTSGEILFSTIWQDKKPDSPISIAHQKHFQVQKQGTANGLYINGPVIGTLAQQTSLVLSLPIQQNGQFKGVVVVGVNPAYLTQQFEKVLNNPKDVAMLLNSSGNYIARSGEAPKNILSLRVPPTRKFLIDPKKRSGRYEAVANIDGIERFYAWFRLEHYPMVVSVGLDKKQATEEEEHSIAHTITHNIIGSIIIWFGFALTSWLFFLHQRNALVLVEHKERLSTLVTELPVGLFQFRSGLDVSTPAPFLYATSKVWDLHGLDSNAMPKFLHELRQHIHPADFIALRKALKKNIADQTSLQATYRLHNLIDNRTRWLRVYIKPEKTNAANTLIWHGYVHDISEELERIKLIQILLDNNAAVILTASWDRKIRHINARAQETLLPQKIKNNALEQGLSFRLIHIDDESFVNFNQHYEILRRTGRVHCEYLMRDNTGQPRWFDIHGSILDPDDPKSDIIWTCIDIDSRRRTEIELARAQLATATVIGRFPDGALLVEERNNNKISVANAALCQILQLPEQPSEIIGQTWSEFIHSLPEEKRACFELSTESNRTCITREHQLSNNTTLEVDHIPLSEKEQGLITLWVIRDISERKERELTLKTLAATDPLTSLPNRRTFIEHLNETIRNIEQEHAAPSILVMIDLDHFKHINDTWGHAVGDTVLRNVARLLQVRLRRSDLAGRIGGEEFAVLLHNATAQIGLRLMNRLREEFSLLKISTPSGEQISFTASMGLAELYSGIKNAEQILINADKALYTAKRTGRNRVILWDDTQDELTS